MCVRSSRGAAMASLGDCVPITHSLTPSSRSHFACSVFHVRPVSIAAAHLPLRPSGLPAHDCHPSLISLC